MNKLYVDTSCVYYVDNRFCAGDKCVYSGMIMVAGDALLSVDNVPWTIKLMTAIDGAEVQISEVMDTDIEVEIQNNAAAAQAIYGKLIEKIDEGVIFIPGVDMLCVTMPPEGEDASGKGCIYLAKGYVMETEIPVGVIRYLGDMHTSPTYFYHLCRNISYIFGSCKQDIDGSDSKNSNIYSELTEHTETPMYGVSDKPIILGNCMLCNYCIDNCPRKAIHNKLDESSNSITSIDAGEIGSGRQRLYEQYYKNSLAIEGHKAYSRQWGGATVNIEYPGYMYVAYASDASGSDFSDIYDENVHTYVGIRTSDEIIESPGPEHFMGLWHRLGYEEPPSWFTYVAYASDMEGSDFSLTYNGAVHLFVATLSTDTYISSPNSSNFIGLWRTISTGEESWDGGEWS